MNRAHSRHPAIEPYRPASESHARQTGTRGLLRAFRRRRHPLPSRKVTPPQPAAPFFLLALFRRLFRRGISLLALAPAGALLLSLHFPFAEIGLALFAALLILLARLNPIARTRERAFHFTAPVTFGLLLWMGLPAAALGALAACFALARFGDRLGSTRQDIRFQGARWAVAALLSSLTMTALIQPNTPILHTLQGALVLQRLAVQDALVTAIAGALTFTLCSAAIAFVADTGKWRKNWFASDSRALMSRHALAYAMGLFPIVALAPLGQTWGLLIGLPAFAMLLLSAHAAQLGMEVKSLRGQLEVAEAMGRASIMESGEPDPTALLDRFLTLSQELVASERALVWMMEPESGILRPVAALPDVGVFADQAAAFGEGLIGQAAARMRPRLVADAARDPRRGRREVASGAWLLYPIVVHEWVLGVAQWTRPVHRPFSKADIARLDALVPQAAIALENVRIRAAMQRQAATDGLTGLWNHRKMQEILRDEMRRAARYHRPISILMMDVDSFKTFNDMYGHPQGDELLRQIAAILGTNVRTVDYVGRYGGEEFIVVLPETLKDDACRMAERIRCSVEEQACLIIDGNPIRRTISVGVAAYPEDALNPGELVQRADEALYRAKHAGKNCVIWA